MWTMTKKEFSRVRDIHEDVKWSGEMLRFLTRRGWVWEGIANPFNDMFQEVYRTLDDEMRGTLIKYYANRLDRLQKEMAELVKEE